MGATVHELTVIDIRVQAGTKVSKGEKIAELESDKSVFEFEAPCDGHVQAVVARAGDILPSGSPFMRIETGDESLRQAREALGLALGFPEQVGVARDVNISGLERSALRICIVADSVDTRPDIAAARKRLDVAKRNIDNVYYQFAPTLNAQSTVGSTLANLLGLCGIRTLVLEREAQTYHLPRAGGRLLQW